ncbi:triosephosphate isomerase [Cognatiyoonia koreensis]|uniref:Triosephosphate isomerase n=1 Tax=Cognatiyoonia koreensis TaxID=364200 RepID=A0A1I0PQQ6_9RHOB|nr:triose-phosphate isomerase [Cognatiyoonia koreensis]SEW16631.1 triosephosphate isomerase [Cognatiyoonia koreensis]
MPRKIAAGNWKMNGTAADLDQIKALASAHPSPSVEILICPPATLVAHMADAAGPIKVGGQDCHAEPSGAHTGDIAAPMLAAAGATAVIVGHSERRTDHAETDAIVQAKARAAHAAGLTAVICIGETLQEREAGTTLSVIDTQLSGSVPEGASDSNTVIAYEPLWAIGTGKVPTLDQIAEVHAHIRAKHTDLAILYGGSVKGSNATEIFGVPHVNGALVGGASLKANDFSPIVTALENA